jgi:hypothetical protein
MWEPRGLTAFWAFTACYRDSFTFPFLPFTCERTEVHTAMIMKCTIFWDVTPYSLIKPSEELTASIFRIEE